MKPVILLATFAALAMAAVAQQPAPVQQAQQAASQQPAPSEQPASEKQPARSFGVADIETLHPSSTAADPLTLSILRSAGCPVGLKASFNSSTQMMKVRKPGSPDPNPAPGPSQHIRLSLGNHAQNPIVSVRITAYGLTARGRIARAEDSMAKGPSQIRRTMEIAQFFTDQDGNLYADLVLPDFTAVNSVKLESMRFGDGSTRDFAGQSLCSVPVDPMMLVSER